MSRLPRHKLPPSSRARSRLMIVVLMAVAATVLLALPATANARPDKKHLATYSYTLKQWAMYHVDFATTFNGNDGILTAGIAGEKTLVGSTDPSAVLSLQMFEQQMQAMQQDLADGHSPGHVLTAIIKLAAKVHLFPAKAASWFAKQAEKVVLRNGCRQFESAIKQYGVTVGLQAQVAGDLAAADIDGANSLLTLSENAAVQASDGAFAALKLLNSIK